VFHRELADFLQRLKSERRLSPHTVTGYQRDLNALIGFCERERIETFDALDSYQVRRFAAESHRRGLNARSIARRLSAVRTFLHFLVEIGALKSNAAVHAGAEAVAAAARDARYGSSREPARDRRRHDLAVRDRAMLELFIRRA
jgi:integrase/recombinase XerC